MTQKSEIGVFGENLACEYLKNNGYHVLERNFQKPWGELDIIAKHKDGTLVFVEVKTMTEGAELKPEDQLTQSKLKKLRRTASMYAGVNEELIKDSKGWRLDLIAIDIPKNVNIYSLTDIKKGVENYKIRHWENV